MLLRQPWKGAAARRIPTTTVFDLSPVRELVSLQRRCAANLNQVAIHANTYGVYPGEIAALQKDYAELWGRVSEVLKQLAAVVEL